MSTELELVNHLLRTVGDNTTSTLETQHPSVTQARGALQTYNKTFQTKGWWFNKEYGLKLNPDVQGRIKLPVAYLEFIPAQPEHNSSSPDEKTRYVKRNGYIYDTRLHTNVLNKSLYLDVLTLLPIEDLPDVAAMYLMHYSAAEYYLDDDGDIKKKDALNERKGEAWANLSQAQLRHTAPNARQGPFAAKLLHRVGQYGSPSNPNWPGGR